MGIEDLVALSKSALVPKDPVDRQATMQVAAIAAGFDLEGFQKENPQVHADAGVPCVTLILVAG